MLTGYGEWELAGSFESSIAGVKPEPVVTHDVEISYHSVGTHERETTDESAGTYEGETEVLWASTATAFEEVTANMQAAAEMLKQLEAFIEKVGH
jgi:hypothetical protein